MLKYFYEDRKITASGHETTDTDPGIATSKDDYSLETYILGTDHYRSNCWQISTRCPKPGPSSWRHSQSPKAAQGFRPGSLRLRHKDCHVMKGYADAS